MTAAIEGPARPGLTLATGAVVAGGAALLAVRPLLANDGHPVGTLIGLFVVLLVVGWLWPLNRHEVDARSIRVVGGLALGLVAFGLGRVLGGGHSPAPFAARAIALNSLAAVAEEAFFRRLVFGVLAPGGTAVAVGGSALLFALVHVTVYGWWVLPLDLAAGLILGWQRQATGRWWVPTLTHVVANVLVVI